MFMDLCHLHFMLKNWSLIFVTPFCIVRLRDSKLNPAKHGLEKVWGLHELLSGASVQHEIWLQKLSPKKLLDEDVPDSLFWPMFGQTVTWVFPIRWLKWKRMSDVKNHEYSHRLLHENLIQTNQAHCMEKEEYLFWCCFATRQIESCPQCSE